MAEAGGGEPRRTIDVVLFDIDGTLISSGGAGGEAWKRAFLELYDVPADIGEFSDAGMTDPTVGRKTFEAVVGHEPTRRELARLLACRQRHLPDAVAESEGYRVLDGVRELLSRLADEGILLGLTTGGTAGAAHIKLERGHLNRWFHFGGYGSDSEDRAELTRTAVRRAEQILGEKLDASEMLVVGDTPLDVSAGHEAGAPVVGVASGKYAVDELREAGADYALTSLADGFPA
jgi:phosphoglycolate phosphatase-like HAD superfamily hydrolase